jgi:hypothetical protein
MMIVSALFPQDGEVRRGIGKGPHHYEVDLGHFDVREP